MRWPSRVWAGSSWRVARWVSIWLAARFGGAVFQEVLWVGVDDDDAVVAVDDDEVAGGDFGGDVGEPDDGGDSHGAGDDGGVAGAAPGIGGEAFHVDAVEGGGLAGEQIVGDEDAVGGELGDVEALAAGEAEEELALDVLDVPAALGKHVVGDFREAAGVFFENGADGVFGGALVGENVGVHLFDDGFVAEDADMNVHDGGDFLAIGGEKLLALVGEVANGILDGVVKALGLGGDVGGGDLPAGNDQILGIEHDGGADGDSGRNSDSLF